MTSFAILDIDPSYMLDSDGNVYGPSQPFPSVKGRYYQLTIGGKRRYLHRLIAETFVPNPDGKPVVAHGDNNGLNDAAWNLRLATHAENMADKRLHGTQVAGERHGNAKLSDADVIRIRELKNDEYWHVDKIAETYGVSRWTIYDACNPKRRQLVDY